MKRRSFFFLAGIWAILVLALCVLGAIALFGKEDRSMEGSGNAGPFLIDDDGRKTADDNRMQKETDKRCDAYQEAEPDKGDLPYQGKEKSTLTREGETVTFFIPGDFSSCVRNEAGDGEFFSREDLAVTAYCSLQSDMEELGLDSALAYIEADKNGFYNPVKEKIEIQTMDVNGRIYYWFVVHYKFEGSDFQYLYAACNVGENAVYKVQADMIDEEGELSMDIVRDFLILE